MKKTSVQLSQALSRESRCRHGFYRWRAILDAFGSARSISLLTGLTPHSSWTCIVTRAMLTVHEIFATNSDNYIDELAV